MLFRSHWRQGRERSAELPPIRWKRKALASLAYMATVKFQLRRLSQGERTNPDVSPLRALIGEQLRTARERLEAVQTRWARLDADLRRAGITGAPESRGDYAELMATIDRALTDGERAAGPTHALLHELTTARRAVERLDEDIASARSKRTTVPRALLAVREQLAAALSLPESALPFAAELIEVPPEHARWRGAIERVLRPFALTMLVPSQHLSAVRRWVDTEHLAMRFVFEEVSRDAPPPPSRAPRRSRSE